MTVFTASQPVTLTPTAFFGIFNFLQHNPVFETASSTDFKLENQAHSIEIDFKGIGFTFSNHGPTGGTLTSLQINMPAGTIAYKFSGMSIPIMSAVTDVNTHNYAGLLNLLLPGHDVIKGSSGNDHLADYNGHDRITGGLGSDSMFGNHGFDTFVIHVGTGSDHDRIKGFVAGSAANHDRVLLYPDTGLTNLAQVHAHETYDASHNVVLSDTSGDTITFAGIHNKALLVAVDFHF